MPLALDIQFTEALGLTRIRYREAVRDAVVSREMV